MIRGAEKWLAGYLSSVRTRPPKQSMPIHLLVCMADHFEPFRRTIGVDGSVSGGCPRADATANVEKWCDDCRRLTSEARDSDGRPPRHTFFYPEDEYDADCLDILAALCRDGLGEIEIQIHHRNDSAAGLADTLTRYRDTLHREHDALGCDADGNVRYGFVHGNWALCNSRPDGDWCGVNEEIGVLVGSGCYADFTFPSAPSPTQPRTVNTIYRARDTPGRPRGHDGGAPVTVQTDKPANRQTDKRPHLMLIPGPLGLNWRRRKRGFLPRLDTGAVTGDNPPSRDRVDLWIRQQIRVVGKPDWVFVKLHTHGCMPANHDALLGDAMREMHEYLMGSGEKWLVHYVSAREMYNIARAAEDGKTGNPGDFRDYEIFAPCFRPGQAVSAV